MIVHSIIWIGILVTGLSNNYQEFIVAFSNSVEPSSYSEAAKDPKWIQAMKEEIQA